jgi:Pre-mRNA-splicing factor of RES complex
MTGRSQQAGGTGVRSRRGLAGRLAPKARVRVSAQPLRVGPPCVEKYILHVAGPKNLARRREGGVRRAAGGQRRARRFPPCISEPVSARLREPPTSVPLGQQALLSTMSDSDASPPRRPTRPLVSTPVPAAGSDSDASPPRRRPRAGLHSAAEIAREAQVARVADAATARASSAQQEREREEAEARRRGDGRRELDERSPGAPPPPRLGVTRGDGELNAAQRKRSRWDDPMARPGGGGAAAAAGRSDPSADDEYCGPPAPPNRFKITPGPRWDGIDRTNGFENRVFEAAAAAKAKDAARYRADMSGL